MLSDDLVQLFWRLKFDVILALREEKWDFVQWLGTRRSHLLMKQALRRWLRQALFIRIKQKAVGLLGVVLLRAERGMARRNAWHVWKELVKEGKQASGAANAAHETHGAAELSANTRAEAFISSFPEGSEEARFFREYNAQLMDAKKQGVNFIIFEPKKGKKGKKKHS